LKRRRIQPKPALELETVTLRLPAQLVRAVDQYAKYLGGSSDRTYVIAQAIEIALAQDADFQKTLMPGAARPRGRRRPRERVAAVGTCLQSNLTTGGTRSVPPAPSRHTAVFTPALAATHVRPFSLRLP
jgi:hypothetical protein